MSAIYIGVYLHVSNILIYWVYFAAHEVMEKLASNWRVESICLKPKLFKACHRLY